MTRLIDAAATCPIDAILMTLYSTGLRRAEVCRLKVERHRQPAHGDSRSPGQGQQRSRCAAESETAGNTARVLALEEAEGRTCFRRRRNSGRMCPSLARRCLACLPSGRDEQESRRRFVPIRSATAMPRICSNPARICARFSCCSGTPTSKHTTVYLHLSQRHLHAVANPLDALQISDPASSKALTGGTSEVSRPPFEVADIIRAQRRSLHREQPVVAALDSTSRCSTPSHAAARQRWAVIAISVLAAAIRPSRIIPAGTGIARSARPGCAR